MMKKSWLLMGRIEGIDEPSQIRVKEDIIHLPWIGISKEEAGHSEQEVSRLCQVKC